MVASRLFIFWITGPFFFMKGSLEIVVLVVVDLTANDEGLMISEGGDIRKARDTDNNKKIVANIIYSICLRGWRGEGGQSQSGVKSTVSKVV